MSIENAPMQRGLPVMTKFHLTFGIPAVLSVLTAVVAGMAAPAMAQERTYAVAPIAVTGEPAPGTGGLGFEWVAVNDFNLSLSGGLINSYLNDSGVVAFVGSTDPLDPNLNEAVWVGTPGNLTLAGRAGYPVTDGATQIFLEFTATRLNEAGDLAVRAGTVDGELYRGGIWVGPVGSLSLLAALGDPAPGTAGRALRPLWLGAFDDLGGASFYAETTLADGSVGYETGIWTGTPGLLEPVVITGDPAPGTNGQSFSFMFGPLSHNTDTMALYGQIGDPNLGATTGIWTAGPAGLSLVALEGNEAPGAGGRSFKSFEGPYTLLQIAGESYTHGIVGPALTPSGDVAFGAYLVDPIDPVNGRGDHGIWVRDAGGLWLKALAGDPAPGTASAPFLEFNHINFNAQGLIAFDASLNVADPDRDHGIWLGPPDAPGLVVREGDPAPGAAGETFGSLIMGPNLNDSGEIVFNARLRESNTDGVWAGTPGNLALILREGEAVDVKPGDHRTIQSIALFDGGLDVYAEGRNFNNAGQLVFFVTFTDGSKGLLLASPVAAETNLPPVANAGPDLTVTEGRTATLDGTGSTDPEKTVLSFSWTVDAVEVATGPRASVSLFGIGPHTVTLTVTDRGGVSASDDMILTVEPNLPPVASAGLDQTVNHVQAVTLDSTGSSDPEGGVLTHSWSLDGAQIATGRNPTVGPFAVGAHDVTLTVTDDLGASATDSMVLTVVNEAPVANAGADKTIRTLETVGLDGAASSDPEGEALSYVWSLNGAQIATGPAPVVGPFDAGVHTVTLTVTDGHGASATDETIVTVSNRAPVANAGLDRTANHAQTVTLEGAGSADPEGGALGYTWSLGGVQIATGPMPTVGPFEVGVHTITLTVTDDHGATATDSMVITVVNEAPIANAGPNQTLTYRGRNLSVTLDGSASTDPEGGALSYLWTLDGQVVGTSAVVQIDLTSGNYSFTLKVTDDHGASASDNMVVMLSR